MAVGIKLSLRGVDKTFANLNEELTMLVNNAQRSSAIAATGALQIKTPVDTGRARSSWSVGKTNTAKDAAFTALRSTAVLGPVPSRTIETLYITNGTPYIQELNQGSSVQAPPRFIEKTLNKYFTFTAGSVKYT